MEYTSKAPGKMIMSLITKKNCQGILKRSMHFRKIKKKKKNQTAFPEKISIWKNNVECLILPV